MSVIEAPLCNGEEFIFFCGRRPRLKFSRGGMPPAYKAVSPFGGLVPFDNA